MKRKSPNRCSPFKATMYTVTELTLLSKIQEAEKQSRVKYPILAVNNQTVFDIWGNNYPPEFAGKMVKIIKAEGVWLMGEWPKEPQNITPQMHQGSWYFAQAIPAVKVSVTISKKQPTPAPLPTGRWAKFKAWLAYKIVK